MSGDPFLLFLIFFLYISAMYDILEPYSSYVMLYLPDQDIQALAYTKL